MPESLAPALLEASSSLEAALSKDSEETLDDTAMLCRKRKPDCCDDGTGKRCKDATCRRAPLRVVADTEANRQSATSPEIVKTKQQGCAWSSTEKENDSCDKVMRDSGSCGNPVDGIVNSEEAPQSDATKVVPTSSNDSSSLLSSRETLDRHLCDEAEAQQQSDTNGQSVQLPECSQAVALTSGLCADELNWSEFSRPGNCLWQLSCDLSESVSSSTVGLWGTTPVSGPLMCPAPIIPDNGDQKVLVLDMDETLIHASAQELPEVDFKVIDPFGICASKISVKKRPHVEYFLERVAELYKVIIFTAGTKEYATQVLDQLDPNGTLFSHRLFREHCLLVGHLMVKDLRLITSNLSQVIIVDNTPSAYLLQRENGIHIPSYFGVDRNDCELLRLLPLLETLATADDVRPHIVQHESLPPANQFQVGPSAQQELSAGDTVKPEQSSAP